MTMQQKISLTRRFKALRGQVHGDDAIRLGGMFMVINMDGPEVTYQMADKVLSDYEA